MFKPNQNGTDRTRKANNESHGNINAIIDNMRIYVNNTVETRIKDAIEIIRPEQFEHKYIEATMAIKSMQSTILELQDKIDKLSRLCDQYRCDLSRKENQLSANISEQAARITSIEQKLDKRVKCTSADQQVQSSQHTTTIPEDDMTPSRSSSQTRSKKKHKSNNNASYIA